MSRRSRPSRNGAARLAGALALVAGGASAALALRPWVRYGWRQLEVHGDGTELLLAASLLALALLAAGAALAAVLLARQLASVARVVVLELALLFVVACGGAQLERCMRSEGPNPPMRWWPFEAASKPR